MTRRSFTAMLLALIGVRPKAEAKKPQMMVFRFIKNGGLKEISLPVYPVGDGAYTFSEELAMAS